MSNHLLTILEDCGLTFARIAPGEYQVGAQGEAVLAQPPQVDYYIPQVTPKQTILCRGFAISTEPLRWNHWRQLLDHPDVKITSTLLLPEDVERVQSRVVRDSRIEIEPAAGDRQAAFANSERLESTWIARQIEPDPVVEVGAATANKIAGALRASLPRWTEWEIAMRGVEGHLYPWGNDLNVNQLSLETQDYSVDSESVMGYYSYDQVVYFVHSFVAYANQPSPFGLTGLARPGREWNLGKPSLGHKHIMRSISDLGSMAWMIPGIRPNTWSFEGWDKTKKHLAFSGPALPCYTAAQDVYTTAGFRLVLKLRS